MVTTVFIVDDHYMVIEGIRSLLKNEKNIEWLGHATNAASCLSFLQQQSPDIILMDINLPDKSGIDLCYEVKHLYPAVSVIGLSTFNQQSFIQKILDNGASGYVLKNATQQELLEAITAVASGKTYLSFEADKTLQKTPVNPVVFTRREKEILELIAQGLTNNEMASRLFVSAATIETHRKNLLAKSGMKNTASLVRMAIQQNLIE